MALRQGEEKVRKQKKKGFQVISCIQKTDAGAALRGVQDEDVQKKIGEGGMAGEKGTRQERRTEIGSRAVSVHAEEVAS